MKKAIILILLLILVSVGISCYWFSQKKLKGKIYLTLKPVAQVKN